MAHSHKERFKLYILLLLVAASLIQVGILWNTQNQRLPFSFFQAIFRTGKVDPSASFDKAEEDFFMPFRIIASEGFDNPRWIIEQSNDKSENFTTLWREAQYYLGIALKSKGKIVVDLKEKESISGKKSFVFEFKTNIELNLIEGFLNIENVSSNGPDGVRKLVISSWDDIDNSSIAYIYDDKDIYKYNINPKDLNKDKLDEIIAGYVERSDSNSYSIMRESDGANLLGFNPDMLCILNDDAFDAYHVIKSSLPAGISNTGSYDSDEIDKLAGEILGNEKDIYNRALDTNTVEFKTSNSKYRIYNDGLLEYRNLSIPLESDKGELVEAFTNAYKFINRIKTQTLNSATVLYLSSIKTDKKDRYEFAFDYVVNDVPVFVNYKTKSEDTKFLNNALVIEANGSSVLNCNWLLKNFVSFGAKQEYNVGFNPFLETAYTYKNNMSLKTDKSLKNKDVVISYVIDSNVNNQKLFPTWVINTTKGPYIVPMVKK